METMESDNKLSSKILSMIFCIMPVCVVICYFMHAHTVFRYLGIAYGICVTILYIVALCLSGRLIAKLYRLGELVLCLAAGCACSHWNILDGILLGISFCGCLGIVSFIVRKLFPSSKEKKDTTDNVPGMNEDKKNASIPGGNTVFALDEPLPWPEYTNPGEYVIPRLNSDSFDVILSFYDLSDKEIEAFSRNEMTMLLKDTGGVPYLVFDFGPFKVDCFLNIMKVKENCREEWLDESGKSDMVNFLLLDGDSGTLKAVRSHEISEMKQIRSICKAQLGLSKEQVDSHIMSAMTLYSTKNIYGLADSVTKFQVLSLD